MVGLESAVTAAGRKRAGPVDRFVLQTLDVGAIEPFGGNKGNRDAPHALFVGGSGHDID
jgi:hypothetical protein